MSSVDLSPEERAKIVAERADVKYGPFASLHEKMPWMHPASSGIIELRADLEVTGHHTQFFQIVDGEVFGCTKGETIRLPIKWVNAHMTNLSTTETTKEQRT